MAITNWHHSISKKSNKFIKISVKALRQRLSTVNGSLWRQYQNARIIHQAVCDMAGGMTKQEVI